MVKGEKPFNLRIISEDGVEEHFYRTMPEVLEAIKYAGQGDEFIQIVITYIPGYVPVPEEVGTNGREFPDDPGSGAE